MSSRRRYRQPLRAARECGACDATILHRGKHPALVGSLADGRRFLIEFSDSPRYATEYDKILLKRLAREVEEVR
ncbi:MAG: hypothetical protein AAF281_04005 [Pseudomonadota bacterium]